MTPDQSRPSEPPSTTDEDCCYGERWRCSRHRPQSYATADGLREYAEDLDAGQLNRAVNKTLDVLDQLHPPRQPHAAPDEAESP